MVLGDACAEGLAGGAGSGSAGIAAVPVSRRGVFTRGLDEACGEPPDGAGPNGVTGFKMA
jgi:hypothetical protein